MKKNVPDDVILVLVGIMGCILLLWFNLNSIRSSLDFFYLVCGAGGMLIVPMMYSFYVTCIRRINVVVELLEGFVGYV